MYKYIIINRDFGSEETNEVVTYIPNLMLNNNGYKIENSRFIFNVNNTVLNRIRNGDMKVLSTVGNEHYLGAGLINQVGINPNVYFDEFRNKYVTSYHQPILGYIESDSPNNTVFLDTNVNFNMVASGYIMRTDGNNYYMNIDSDWVLGKVEKIVWRFYDEEFNKLALKKIYLNIKLVYGNANIEP